MSNPLNAQSWNSYSYVQNNPLKYTDPSGYCSSFPGEGCNTSYGGIFQDEFESPFAHLRPWPFGTLHIPELASSYEYASDFLVWAILLGLPGARENFRDWAEANFSGRPAPCQPGACDYSSGTIPDAPGPAPADPTPPAPACGQRGNDCHVNTPTPQAPVPDIRTIGTGVMHVPAGSGGSWSARAHIALNGLSILLDASGVGATISWIPDILDAGLSGFEGDWEGAGISLGAMIPGVGIAGNTAKIGRIVASSGKQFSKEKQALVEMAKADKRSGITPEDMEAYKELNKELPDPFPANQVRGPEAHSSGGPHSQQPHGHVGPVRHIPIVESVP